LYVTLVDYSLYFKEYFDARMRGWLGVARAGTNRTIGGFSQMHQFEKSTKAALAVAATLMAVTLAEPASAWQDAYEIIGTIPTDTGKVLVDPIRGIIVTGTRVIDEKTDTVIATIPGGLQALDPIHGKIYLTTSTSSATTLIILDEDSYETTATVTLENGPLFLNRLVVDPLHEKIIYGIEAGANSYVGVVDLRTNELIAKYAVPDDVRGIGLDPVRETIYASISSLGPFSIVALDENTGKVKATIPLVSIAQGLLAVDEEKGLLYVPGAGFTTASSVFETAPGTVVVIDEKTNKIVDTIVVAPFDPTSEKAITEQVVVDPLSDIVFAVTFSAATVVAIDQRTNKIVATIPLTGGGGGSDIAIDPIRRKVYATHFIPGAPGLGNIAIISAPGWREVAFGRH
jgi:DNA-binding beta-propeller fold protein YncE